VDRVWVEPSTSWLRVRYSTTRPQHSILGLAPYIIDLLNWFFLEVRRLIERKAAQFFFREEQRECHAAARSTNIGCWQIAGRRRTRECGTVSPTALLISERYAVKVPLLRSRFRLSVRLSVSLCVCLCPLEVWVETTKQRTKQRKFSRICLHHLTGQISRKYS